MIRIRIPDRGEVWWVDPNPVAGREMKDRHLFLVLSPREINYHGVSITVAVTQGGTGPRELGLTVPITGSKTAGVVVCTQVRSFDLLSPARKAEHYDTLDEATVQDVANKIASIIGA